MKLYIVGAGPGAPDLITVRGQQLIQTADVLLFTDSLVNEALLQWVHQGAEIMKTSGMSLEEMVEIMLDRLCQGKQVVRLHTGDPSLYGAIMEQMVRLRQAGIEVEIVPGVSSVFAAAAALGIELTIPELTQTVILTRAEGRTSVPELEHLRELAKHHTTLALFLSATLTKKVVKELLAAGWDEDTPVAIVYKATWPDQVVVRTSLVNLDAAMREHGIRSHAIILAGKVLGEAGKLGSYRSKLYDPLFTHGYRKGSDE